MPLEVGGIRQRSEVGSQRSEDSIATSCSVKAIGLYLSPILSDLEITNCDLQSSNSFFVSSNMKSSGKRFLFLLTACLSTRVFLLHRAQPDHGRVKPFLHAKRESW